MTYTSGHEQQQNGLALEHASQEMKRDRQVWMAGLAAQQNKLALKDAPEEMKGEAWRYSVACSSCSCPHLPKADGSGSKISITLEKGG